MYFFMIYMNRIQSELHDLTLDYLLLDANEFCPKMFKIELLYIKFENYLKFNLFMHLSVFFFFPKSLESFSQIKKFERQKKIIIF